MDILPVRALIPVTAAPSLYQSTGLVLYLYTCSSPRSSCARVQHSFSFAPPPFTSRLLCPYTTSRTLRSDSNHIHFSIMKGTLMPSFRTARTLRVANHSYQDSFSSVALALAFVLWCVPPFPPFTHEAKLSPIARFGSIFRPHSSSLDKLTDSPVLRR